MTSRSRHYSPKRSPSPATKRTQQLSQLVSQVLPRLLETRLAPRLEVLEQNDPKSFTEILKIRQEVNQLIESSAFLSPEVQELYIKHEPFSVPPLRKSVSPKHTVRALNLDALLAMNEMHNQTGPQEESVIKLSPIRPNGYQGQNLYTHESPGGSFLEQFSPLQSDTRRTPYAFVLKAVEGVKALTKKELIELKSLMSPTPSVVSVMEALCILFEYKPKWAAARILIESGDIISKIVDYDLSSITQAMMEKVDLYVKSPMVNFEKLKVQSPPAAAFWKWIRSVHYYYISNMSNMKSQQTEENQMTGNGTERKREETKKDTGRGSVPSEEEEQEELETSYFTKIEKLLDMLEEATNNVKQVKKRDLIELFSMKYPPSGIKKTVEAVCLVFGEKPTWLNAKKAIVENGLLGEIDQIKLESLPDVTKDKLREIMSDPEMEEELVQKQSKCAGVLNRWVHAVSAIFPQQEIEDLGVKQETENRQSTGYYRGKTPSIGTIYEVSEVTIREDSIEKIDKDAISIPDKWPGNSGLVEVLEGYKELKKHDFAVLKKNKDVGGVKSVLEGLFIVFKAPPSGRVDFKSVPNSEYEKLVGDVDGLVTRIFGYDYENMPTVIQKKLKDHIRQHKISLEATKKEFPVVDVIWQWLTALSKCGENKATAEDKHKVPQILSTLETEEPKETGYSTPNRQLTRTKNPTLSSSRKSVGSLSVQTSAQKDIKGSEETAPGLDMSSRRLCVELDNEELNDVMKGITFSVNEIIELKKAIKMTKPVESALKLLYILVIGTKAPLKDAQKLLSSDSSGWNKLLNVDPEKVNSNAVKQAKMEIRESRVTEDQFDKGSVGYGVYKWAKAVLEICDRHREEALKRRSSVGMAETREKEEVGNETPREVPMSARLGKRSGSMVEMSEGKSPGKATKGVKEKVERIVSARKATEGDEGKKKKEEVKTQGRVKSQDYTGKKAVKVENKNGNEDEKGQEKSGMKEIKGKESFRVQDLVKKSLGKAGDLRKSMEMGINKGSETDRNHRKSTEKLVKKEEKTPLSARKRDVTQVSQGNKMMNRSVTHKQFFDAGSVKDGLVPQKGKIVKTVKQRPGKDVNSKSVTEKEVTTVSSEADGKEMVKNETEENKEEVNEVEGNKKEDTEKIIEQLKEIMGKDMSNRIESGGIDQYVSEKIEAAKEKVKELKSQNESLREGGVGEDPQDKDYVMKASTVSFIQMVEPDWLTELLENEEWDENMMQVLLLFAMIFRDEDERTESRESVITELNKIKGNPESSLLGISEHLHISTKVKRRIQKYLETRKEILNPAIFEGSDRFCGVISFVLKEACEYMGVLPIDLVKKISAKERTYLFNLEKIIYYEDRLEKLTKILNRAS